MSAELASVRVIVSGFVQGVFFRAFTARHANELGLTGYVRNLPSGNAVEVQIEGPEDKLGKMIDYLKTGPPGARVENVETTRSAYTGNYNGFSIRY